MTCSLFIFSSSSQSKAMQLEWEDPPGATSSDFLSEAAKVIFTARRLNDQSTHDGLLSQQIVSKWYIFNPELHLRLKPVEPKMTQFSFHMFLLLSC